MQEGGGGGVRGLQGLEIRQRSPLFNGAIADDIRRATTDLQSTKVAQLASDWKILLLCTISVAAENCSMRSAILRPLQKAFGHHM